MTRNLNPKIAFHIPEDERQALLAQVPEGANLTDLMLAIVREHLGRTEESKAQKAIALRLAVEKLIENM